MMETMKQWGLWYRTGIHGSLVVICWLCISRIFEILSKHKLPAKTIGILTSVFCTSGVNLVILAWTCEESSGGQAQNRVNFHFEVKIWSWRSRSSTPQYNRDIENRVILHLWSKFGILTSTGVELCRGQTRDYRTHRRTDGHTGTQTQATTIPEG